MPKPSFRLTSLCAALSAALSLPVMADDAALPAVTVSAVADKLIPSAEAERAKLARVPGATNLIEPQQQGRLLTLGDALGFQPGLVVQEFFGGTDQPRLNIRGSGIQSNPVNRGVLLLQDGLPLNEADGSFIISLLEPRNAALISVRRGANAIAPSATTLGGELDFQSLTAATDHGTLRIEGGNFGRRNLQTSAGVQRDGWDGHVSVSHDDSDGFRHHADARRTALHANAGISLGGGVENRSYLSYTDVDFSIPTVLTKDRALSDPRFTMGDGNTPQDTLLNNYKRDPRREVRQLRLANRTHWGDAALNQEVGVYAQRTDDLFVEPTSHNVSDSHTYGAQWQLNGSNGRLGYHAAAGWSHTQMDRELYANNAQTGQRMQRFGDYELDADNRDLAAGADWLLAPGLNAVADLKFSHAKRDARNRASGAVLDQSYHYSTPKLGLNWTPVAGQRLYANISRSNEAPTYWEIITGTINPATPAAATSSMNRLRLQRAQTAEIGGAGDFALAGKAGHWSLSIYRSKVEDELISTTDANGVRVGTYNYAADTRHQGIEAGLDGTLPSFGASSLAYRLAWTHSDFTFRGGEFAGKQLAGVPRNVVNAELMQQTGAWRFGPNVRWQPQDTPIDHANTQTQPGYALLGLKAEYRGGQRWSAYVQLDNVADKHYISSYAIRNRTAATDLAFLPGNGRSVLAGINYKF